MATVFPRIQVTPTAELQAVIDAEAKRHPAMPRSEIVVRLALLGARRDEEARAERRERRRAALRETSGKFAYPPNYLEELREDWDR